MSFKTSSELKALLATMDVPKGRLDDPLWLARNLPIKNISHPSLTRAMELINLEGKRLIRELKLDEI